MSEKIRRQYDCLNCDYHTSDKRDYGKHLKTKKHAQSSETTIVQQILSEISDDHKNHFYCSCGKNISITHHYLIIRKTVAVKLLLLVTIKSLIN